MIFMKYVEKKRLKDKRTCWSFVQVVFEGGLQVKITKATVAVFPRVFKKRESSNDDTHDQGQEKMRPSSLC